jgi:quercetin dioxygenase-like cupin family protein
MTALATPIHVTSGQGRTVAIGADLLAVKLSGNLPGETLSVFEYSAAPGLPGPPMHVHRTFDEAWFILDGEVEFALAADLIVGRAGSFLWVPRGATHTFRVVGEHSARWLGILNPGGHLGMLDELGDLLAAGPPTIEAIEALFLRHETTLVTTGGDEW